MKSLEDMGLLDEITDLDLDFYFYDNHNNQDKAPEVSAAPAEAPLQENDNDQDDQDDQDDQVEQLEPQEKKQHIVMPSMPFSEAVIQGNISVVQEYINLNKPTVLNMHFRVKGHSGVTALHLAVEYRQIVIFWQLVEAGASLLLMDGQKRFALYKTEAHLELAKQLWDRRHDDKIPTKNTIPEFCFDILAHHFTSRISENEENLLELCKAVSQQRIKDFLSKNIPRSCFHPLMSIARQEKEYLEVAKFFLNYADEAMLTTQNVNKKNFLHIAFEQAHMKILAYVRSCQNGKFAHLVPEFLAQHSLAAAPEKSPQPLANTLSAAEEERLKLHNILKAMQKSYYLLTEEIFQRHNQMTSLHTMQMNQLDILSQLTEKIFAQVEKIQQNDEAYTQSEKQNIVHEIEKTRRQTEVLRLREQLLQQRLTNLAPPTTQPIFYVNNLKRSHEEMAVQNNNNNNNNNQKNTQ